MKKGFASLFLAACLVGCTQVHDASLGSNASNGGGDGASNGDGNDSQDGSGDDGDQSGHDGESSSSDGGSDSASSDDHTGEDHDAGVDAGHTKPTDDEAGEWWHDVGT